MTPTSGSVLLVDDDASLLAGLRRALQREPYRVVTAESPAAAFARLDAEAVDLVVSDDNMPGMTGTEFLARVQREHPDTVRMILTGRASLEVAMRAINQGQVSRFFTKPCDPAELATAIRHALLERALRIESRRLLHTVRRQAALMADLETEASGLTAVRRDESGAVVVDDAPTDLEALVKELQEELTVADGRLREGEERARQRHTPRRTP
jgi:two-component system probable response regulator PhcQ